MIAAPTYPFKLQLSTHPSEYKPMGRYTEECKEIIEKVHKEDFL